MSVCGRLRVRMHSSKLPTCISRPSSTRSILSNPRRLPQGIWSHKLAVVSPTAAPVPLLERVDDARRLGATIFALDQGDSELDALAHEQLAIRNGVDAVSFGAAQHLISSAVGDLDRPGGWQSAEFGVANAEGRMRPPGTPGDQRPRLGVRGLRDRVARLLDAVSGPTG